MRRYAVTLLIGCILSLLSLPDIGERVGGNKTNRQDGAEMIYIPEGDFLMGDSDRNGNPRRTVPLKGYYIYKNLVTVAQYRKFTEASGYKYDWDSLKPNWGWKDDYPMVNVSWNDAQAYCAWASKDGVSVHLPSEKQWERAARGTQGLQYPWGNDFDGMKCANSVSPNDLKSTVAVGSYPSGASPDGVLDMAGNVWQWCEDWSDSKQATKVIRGGSWGSDGPDVFRSSFHFRFAPVVRGDDIGFRCASGP